MKVLIELFSGIGGFAKGLQDAGFEFDKHYFSEVDVHAIANYKYNFKNAEYIGSVKFVRHIIRTINRKPEDRIILTFGSPCQDFSLAGKGSGLKGDKSSLIKYAIFLIKWLRPDVYIWENVKGTYSANDGADYWAIMQAFANFDGYRCEQQLLNTSWFLPQNRERIYTVGHLTGRSEPGVFPIGESDNVYNETGTNEKEAHSIASCLNAKGQSNWTGSFVIQLNECKESGGKQPYQQNRIYDADGIAPAIDQAAGRWQTKIKYKDWDTSQDNRIHLSDGLAPCLGSATGASKPKIEHDEVVRRLTEIECERLQGFPDNWTQYGDFDNNGRYKMISKTQRYKMCGNAVSVPVVREIGIRLLSHLTPFQKES